MTALNVQLKIHAIKFFLQQIFAQELADLDILMPNVSKRYLKKRVLSNWCRKNDFFNEVAYQSHLLS